jgi:hypothetical protein
MVTNNVTMDHFGPHASFMDKDDLALFCVSSKAKKKKKKTNDFERAFTDPKVFRY